jgi:Ca-activated chloride channel family protein
MKSIKHLIFDLFVVVFILSACESGLTEKVDDWVYSPNLYEFDYSVPNGAITPMTTGSMAESVNIGFSVGGAKDINNFRENIENGYLPLPTDLTYEGLFYDYYFDTGEKEKCEKLFCPSYSYAISKDPLSRKDDYYLSVGLNSGIKESDFERKKLNLVVVLDISGSMSSPFDGYYYDNFGNIIDVEGFKYENKTKMQIANEAVSGLLGNLRADDRFGMVLFDDIAYLGKPLSLVGNTNMNKIKNHILDLQPMNGTNMEAGMKMGTSLFDEYLDADQSEYENRIIFLTDAMPNIGYYGKEDLLEMVNKNANDKIYTSFIGIGVDFNTELTEAITKVRGANYYSVHSSEEFMKRMDEEFEFMVTPLVFNLELTLDAEGYEIEKVYGSPEADESTGQLMKVNTLFPSKTDGGETRGGIVLLKLKKTSANSSLSLKASYEDRNGKKDYDESEIEFKEVESDFYENNGIRKGILLARYADLVKNWLIEENDLYENVDDDNYVIPYVNENIGIICPPPFPYPIELNEWERESLDLSVSTHYKRMFERFSTYYMEEMSAISDKDLRKELDVLDLLIEAEEKTEY